MNTATGLLIAASNAERIVKAFLEDSPTRWAGSIGLTVLIICAVWWISRYRSSLDDDADPAAANVDFLRNLRELKSRGEITEEEYRSLKGRLVSPPDRDSFASSIESTNPGLDVAASKPVQSGEQHQD